MTKTINYEDCINAVEQATKAGIALAREGEKRPATQMLRSASSLMAYIEAAQLQKAGTGGGVKTVLLGAESAREVLSAYLDDRNNVRQVLRAFEYSTAKKILAEVLSPGGGDPEAQEKVSQAVQLTTSLDSEGNINHELLAALDESAEKWLESVKGK